MKTFKHLPKDQESGVILVTVLWLVALISVLVMGALQEWRTELKLAANFQAKAQCRRLAEGGVYYAIGKILAREIAARNPEASLLNENSQEFWLTDGRAHTLKLPVGRIEVIITDEAGKLNLNSASRESLEKIFTVWEYPSDQVKTMVEAILDWRTGAPGLKINFSSLSLVLINTGTNNSFDTVEEILWLPGCAGLAPPRLSACFTVQMVDGGINLNAASPDVLMALGLTAAQSQQIIDARSVQPFRDLQALSDMVDFSQRPELQPQVSLQASVFYTIFSSGMVDYNKSRHSVKAIVRLDLDKPEYLVHSLLGRRLSQRINEINLAGKMVKNVWV